MDAFLELAGNSLKECSTQIQPLLQKLGCASGSRCKCSIDLAPFGSSES